MTVSLSEKAVSLWVRCLNPPSHLFPGIPWLVSSAKLCQVHEAWASPPPPAERAPSSGPACRSCSRGLSPCSHLARWHLTWKGKLDPTQRISHPHREDPWSLGGPRAQNKVSSPRSGPAELKGGVYPHPRALVPRVHPGARSKRFPQPAEASEPS